jgi:hypothetical protein
MKESGVEIDEDILVGGGRTGRIDGRQWEEKGEVKVENEKI